MAKQEVEEIEVEETEVSETLTVKELAEEIGTTGRLLRRFIRSQVVEAGGVVGEDTPGKGKRYSFTRGEADELKELYSASLTTEENEDEEDELEDDEILVFEDDTSDPH